MGKPGPGLLPGVSGQQPAGWEPVSSWTPGGRAASQRPAGVGGSGSHVDAHAEGLSSGVVLDWEGCLGWGPSSEDVPLELAWVAQIGRAHV